MNDTRNLQIGNIFINKSKYKNSDKLQVVMPSGVKTISFKDEESLDWEIDDTYSPKGLSLVASVLENNNKKYAEPAVYIENTKTILGLYTGNLINNKYLEIVNQGNIEIELVKDELDPCPRILGFKELLESINYDYTKLLGTKVYWNILKLQRDKDTNDLINLTVNLPSDDFSFINIPLVGVIIGIRKDANLKISHIVLSLNIDIDDYSQPIIFRQRLNIDSSSNIREYNINSLDNLPQITNDAINTISIDNINIPMPSLNNNLDTYPNIELDISLELNTTKDNENLDYELNLDSYDLIRENNNILYSAKFSIPKGFELISNDIYLLGSYKLLDFYTQK